MRYLLDKNIVRFALEGLRFGKYRPLRKFEKDSLTIVQKAAASKEFSLFISDRSFNIMKKWISYREVQQLLSVTNILYPTQYHKRWSRRVRETAGLSREDSVIIALATFSRTGMEEIIGVDAVLTFDQPMINGYRQHQNQLSLRLKNMTSQLSPPYNAVRLPEVYSSTKEVQ